MAVFSMSWYLALAWISLGICFAACLFHLVKIIAAGKPLDYSEPSGDVRAGVAYSFTGGMNPRKKESAYLHLPTYAAGILFHLGTFLSFALLLCFLLKIRFNGPFPMILAAFLVISGSCGTGILVKRMVNKNLRFLSNPDDYISNLLVTLFQLATVVYLQMSNPAYFLVASALLLYLPAGKLKHTVYFFAARYHLGFFFGRRNVWPPKY